MRRRRSEHRVLLVEDDNALRELVRVVLSESGYVVEAAEDGATALRILETRGAQLAAVVLDLVLPDLPGRLVFARARQICPGLPVIVATGAIDASIVGADLVILKPYGPNDVVRALDAMTLGVDEADVREQSAK